MKHQEDKHRSEREFEVGDKVFLKLQPYIQQSVARRPWQKLAFRYFAATHWIGGIQDQLARRGSHIHPVVHVSLLAE
jgi:hypothetical protein